MDWSGIVAHLIASTVTYVLVPVLLSLATARSIRAIAVVATATVVVAFDAGLVVANALVAASLSGGIGLVLTFLSSGRQVRTACGVCLTVALMFLLPCHFIPANAEPYYLRGAETILLCATMAVRSSSVSSTWTIWAVSPSFTQFEIVPSVLPLRASVGNVVAGLGAFVAALGATTKAMENQMPVAGTIASIALAIPALGTVRYGGCHLAGFDPGRGFAIPTFGWNLQQFWSRWNRWYGRAFGDFVFVPLTRWLLASRLRPRVRARYLGAIGCLATFACVGVHHDACRALTMVSLGTAGFSEAHLETLAIFVVLGLAAAIDTCLVELRAAWLRKSIRALLVVASFAITIGAVVAWRP